MRNYSGGIRLFNYSQTENRSSIDITSGQVQLTSSVTGGYITARGVGYITDDSSGAIINVEGLISKATIAEAVWDEPVKDHLISGTTGRSLGIQQFDGRVWIDINNGSTGTEFPKGTERSPVNNLTDAKIIAETNNLERIHINGDVSLNDNFSTYRFEADNPGSCTINLNGYTIQDAIFENMTITGDCSGYIWAYNIRALDVSSLQGFGNIVTFGGTTKIAAGSSFQASNWETFGSPNPAVCDLNNNGTLTLGQGGGLITVGNMTDASATLSMSGTYVLTLESTITSGSVLLGGSGSVTDNKTSSDLYVNLVVPRATWTQDITTITDASSAANILNTTPSKTTNKIVPFLFTD